MVSQVSRQKILQKRATYASFEKAIIDLYDQNRLTLAQLDRVAYEYRWRELDSAGSLYIHTYDDKDLYQVCIELVDPTFPQPVRGSSEDHEIYWEAELKKWEEIVSQRWQWRAYGVRAAHRLQIRDLAA